MILAADLASPSGEEVRMMRQMARRNPEMQGILSERLARLAQLEEKLDMLSKAEASRSERSVSRAKKASWIALCQIGNP